MSSIITAEDPGSRKRVPSSSGIAIQDIGEDKSLAYDLNTERGIVSSRVTMLLRSAEIKPMFYRFVLKENTSPPPRPFPEGVCPAGLVRVCLCARGKTPPYRRARFSLCQNAQLRLSFLRVSRLSTCAWTGWVGQPVLRAAGRSPCCCTLPPKDPSTGAGKS